MPDPTEAIIIATFCAACAIFAVTAWARRTPTLVEISTDGDKTAAEILPPPLPVGRVPVWFYRQYDLIGLAAIFGIFFYLVVGSLDAQKAAGNEKLDVQTLVASIVLQFLLAGAVSGFVIWRVRPVEWLGLRWKGWRWVFLIAPASVVGMWLIFGTLQLSGYMRWIESFGVETVQDTVKILQDSTDPPVLLLMSFAAVIVAPLCEEIVFRGYLYSASKRFTGPWVAMICSGLVFAAAHGSIAALLPLFIFGCLLAVIYEKTGSLWAPCAIHFCFNAATVAVQMGGRYFDLPLDGAS